MSKQGNPSIHAWHIEDREYARQEERRGRRYAFERIDPLRTALVVVDMVPFFVEEMEYCRGIVPNIGRLASSLRHLGGTVAWVLPGGQAASPRSIWNSTGVKQPRPTSGPGARVPCTRGCGMSSMSTTPTCWLRSQPRAPSFPAGHRSPDCSKSVASSP